jgi:hypothetical protein
LKRSGNLLTRSTTRESAKRNWPKQKKVEREIAARESAEQDQER